MIGRHKIQMYLIVVNLMVASQAAEARLARLCAKTAYPTLCQPLVKGRNPRQATRSTICALEGKTKLAIVNAARYRNGNKAVSICYSTLKDAAFNLRKARKNIWKTKSLKKFLTAAVSDYGVCVEGFIASRQTNTLQNAADELRKIGTNCLLLATLIR